MVEGYYLSGVSRWKRQKAEEPIVTVNRREPASAGIEKNIRYLAVRRVAWKAMHQVEEPSSVEEPCL